MYFVSGCMRPWRWNLVSVYSWWVQMDNLKHFDRSDRAIGNFGAMSRSDCT